MGYPDSSAAYCDDSSLFKGLMVTLDYCANCCDSLGHSNIGQEDQSRVCNSSQVNQSSKVLVHRDKNSVICSRSFQQSPVTWIPAEGSGFNNVMSIVAQPLRQPASGASVDQEPHGAATETGARVSPAITVWA